MKSIKLRKFLMIASIALLLCSAIYFSLPQEFRWAITSIIEVPICTARITKKLKINGDFFELKSYIIQSLYPGMSSEEVERTLSQFGQIHIKNSFVDDEQETNMEILIELCDNPFGNLVLLVYYSKDGHLTNVVDPYAE